MVPGRVPVYSVDAGPPIISQLCIGFSHSIAKLMQSRRKPTQTRPNRAEVLLLEFAALVIPPILAYSRPQASKFDIISLQPAFKV
jgi:hypothetical protein